MRILVTGAGGMLACALVPELARRGHEVVPRRRDELDVTNRDAVFASVEQYRPEAVVQCAAYTAVDAAEADSESAVRVNEEATDHVAQACQRIGALLVYPSTDYVFSGATSTPYRPDDPPDPINAYGRSKLGGERAALRTRRALVVRTSWLYGAGGRNFVDTIVEAAKTRDRLEVVADQFGRPTWTVRLASAIAALIEENVTGIHHLTSAGPPVSWFELAGVVLALEGLRTPIVPISTAAFGRAASRPLYSVLDCSSVERVLECRLPHWRDDLAEYLRRRAADGRSS